MKFIRLVETAGRVASRGARKAKQEALAQLLQSAPVELIRPAVAMLSGDLPSGRLGVGYASVREARSERSAAQPELSLQEVLDRLSAIGSTRGPGSKGRKNELLTAAPC